jgi:hypothetical protein
VPQRPDIWGSAGCGSRYRRCAYGRRRRSRGAPHPRPAPPCSSHRSRSSLSWARLTWPAIGLAPARAMVAEDLRDDVNKQGDNRAHADLHLRHIIICIWVCCSKTRSLTTAAGVIPCVQETGRQLNNPAENSHQPLRRGERAMQRFRQMRTLQKFAAIRSSVHDHFNQERHLDSRQNFKLNPAAALAQWRELSTA